MIVYKCHRCGFILLKSKEVLQPKEVLGKLGLKRCPRCLAPLSETPRQIKLTPRPSYRRRKKPFIIRLFK